VRHRLDQFFETNKYTLGGKTLTVNSIGLVNVNGSRVEAKYENVTALLTCLEFLGDYCRWEKQQGRDLNRALNAAKEELADTARLYHILRAFGMIDLLGLREFKAERVRKGRE
jgi:hypothetical protein